MNHVSSLQRNITWISLETYWRLGLVDWYRSDRRCRHVRRPTNNWRSKLYSCVKKKRHGSTVLGHRGQRTNISHSETVAVGREGGTRFLEPNLAFAYFDIISSFWIKKTCTHTPTVFCCIPMAVCHRWSRYLPIYISFARGMLKVTTTYARRMCWL